MIIPGGLREAKIKSAVKINVIIEEIRPIRFWFCSACGFAAKYKSFTKIEED